MTDVLYVKIKKNNTLENRVRWLEFWNKVLFGLTIVICIGLLYEIIDRYNRKVKYDNMIGGYLDSKVLADSANNLVIINALRWKTRLDSIETAEKLKNAGH